MNKKGFTLVELLGVIVILAIILLIAVPAISGVSNSIKNKQRQNVISRIKTAASKYAFDTEEEMVYVEDLIKQGYLDADNKNDEILDPVNNSSMNCYKLEMTKKGNYYEAVFIDNNEMVDGKCNK